MWLIETRGPKAEASANAIIPATVSPRPAVAHIVGTVKFSHSTRYDTTEDFRADENGHCILAGGQYDWTGGGEMYAWHVAEVHRLLAPVLAPKEKTMVGLMTPHALMYSSQWR